MKIIIVNKNKKQIINLSKLTQLLGYNFSEKDFIVNSIIKHFSTYKYKEYEEYMIDNIFFDLNVKAGREFFQVININNKNDLISFIKLSKASLFQEYINNELKKFDSQCHIEEIRDILNKIYYNLNESIVDNIGNIKIDFDNENLFNIVQKSEVYNINELPIESNTSFELFEIVLNIIDKIQSTEPRRLLVIVNNIDHMVGINEYKALIKHIITLINKSNTYFFTTLSIQGYPVVEKEYLEGINIVNDIVFNIENFEMIKEFLIYNYPIFINFSDDEILQLYGSICHQIGKNNDIDDIRSRIVLKLINNSIAFESKFNCKHK